MAENACFQALNCNIHAEWVSPSGGTVSVTLANKINSLSYLKSYSCVAVARSSLNYFSFSVYLLLIFAHFIIEHFGLYLRDISSDK
jgi:hypothetical protein